MSPPQVALTRLGNALAKTKTALAVLKRAAAYFARDAM
jgi:hypothetical protein